MLYVFTLYIRSNCQIVRANQGKMFPLSEYNITVVCVCVCIYIYIYTHIYHIHLYVCVCIIYVYFVCMSVPIPVAMRSRTWVCVHSLAGIAGLNPYGDIIVCLLSVLCVVR
jgi:hypothetical protein